MFAAESGDTRTVTLLIEGGSEVNAKEKAMEQTPLMFAAAYNRVDVVKLLIFLTDMADRPAMTPVRREFFGDTRPASTLVGVNALAVDGMRVEIDATALLPTGLEAGG